jgi:spore coat polysaccharide biosynthesis protein SpsF
MSTAIFIQARLNSKRLPGKMLMEIEGKTILEHCLQSAKRIKVENYVLLTTKQDYKYFKEIAEKNNYYIIKGPENDVLKRFTIGINKFKPNRIVRITGDKIILSKNFQRMLLNQKEVYDLVSYDDNPVMSTTGGVFKSEFLVRADKKEKLSKEAREHIKPCRDEVNCLFKALRSPSLYKKYNINFSIDTIEDLQKMIDIYKILYKGNPISFSEILEYYDNTEIYNKIIP